MAAANYNQFGRWNENIEVAKSKEVCHPHDYDKLTVSSLFGLCVRYFALQQEETKNLPQFIAQKIEILQYDMDIVRRMHEGHVTFKISWICVGKDGYLDWPGTYAKCFREMPADDFFIFAAIHGIATKALWQRMDESEKQLMQHSYNDLIRHTALLMFHSSIFKIIQYKSIVVAAYHGWPGAICAWVGVQNNSLNNINYQKELAGDDLEAVRFETFVSSLNYTQLAVLLAIRNGQYHMLRYLPAISLSDSFYHLFPDGRVRYYFFRQLTNFPANEYLLNDKLSDYLESIAQALLIWMPQLDIQRLQREVEKSGDTKTRNYINRILNNNDKGN
ncbi:unnamed protein product [Onchocerca ochengi]|uniref:Uncharacterized protein n=1 Tax=Onchocerca ochengi TaxID=42157 RepID=A0A182ED48_ONCOC|nr:unnamed protein product [Onchocerca ochengi]